MGWRWHARIPGLPADLPAIQKLAARATEYLLYVLLLVQPVLGILHINARGTRVNVFFLGELPAFISPNKILANKPWQRTISSLICCSPSLLYTQLPRFFTTSSAATTS